MEPPIIRYNNSVAQARNQIAAEAFQKRGCDWVFWLDDDMLFSSDSLMKMLQRPEQIVIGLTMMRCQAADANQFYPIWSDRPMKKGADGLWQWTSVGEIRRGPNGLMPLTSGTGGGVLTRREVFDVIPRPWWAMGQHDPEMFFEDIFFYEKAAEYGFQVWGNPDVKFGHYSPDVLWPYEAPDGTWNTGIAHGFEVFAVLPWQQPVEAVKG